MTTLVNQMIAEGIERLTNGRETEKTEKETTT
jgi:hypothetical protein